MGREKNNSQYFYCWFQLGMSSEPMKAIAYKKNNPDHPGEIITAELRDLRDFDGKWRRETYKNYPEHGPLPAGGHPKINQADEINSEKIGHDQEKIFENPNYSRSAKGMQGKSPIIGRR